MSEVSTDHRSTHRSSNSVSSVNAIMPDSSGAIAGGNLEVSMTRQAQPQQQPQQSQQALQSALARQASKKRKLGEGSGPPSSAVGMSAPSRGGNDRSTFLGENDTLEGAFSSAFGGSPSDHAELSDLDAFGHVPIQEFEDFDDTLSDKNDMGSGNQLGESARTLAPGNEHDNQGSNPGRRPIHQEAQAKESSLETVTTSHKEDQSNTQQQFPGRPDTDQRNKAAASTLKNKSQPPTANTTQSSHDGKAENKTLQDTMDDAFAITGSPLMMGSHEGDGVGGTGDMFDFDVDLGERKHEDQAPEKSAIGDPPSRNRISNERNDGDGSDAVVGDSNKTDDISREKKRKFDDGQQAKQHGLTKDNLEVNESVGLTPKIDSKKNSGGHDEPTKASSSRDKLGSTVISGGQKEQDKGNSGEKKNQNQQEKCSMARNGSSSPRRAASPNHENKTAQHLLANEKENSSIDNSPRPRTQNRIIEEMTVQKNTNEDTSEATGDVQNGTCGHSDSEGRKIEGQNRSLSKETKVTEGNPCETESNSSSSLEKTGEVVRSNNNAAQQRFLPRFDKVASIDSIKMHLFLEASKVHRGRGTERIFASYWETLGRYVSASNPTPGSRSCISWYESVPDVGSLTGADGIEAFLGAFLKTKKMRVLHNRLILALMHQSMETQIAEISFEEHIPTKWVGKTRRKRRLGENVSVAAMPKTADISRTEESTQAQLLLEERRAERRRWQEEYSIDSGVWSNCSDEHLRRTPATDKKEDVRFGGALLPTGPPSEADDCLPDPYIPGSVTVDPLVRDIAERHGLSVTDHAIWMIVIAARQYVSSVLSRTVEDASAHEGRKKKEPERASKKSTSSNLITSFDLASSMTHRPVVSGGVLNPASARFSWELLVSSGGSRMASKLPGVSAAVQTSINSVIHEASTKRRKVQLEQDKSSENSMPPPASISQQTKNKSMGATETHQSQSKSAGSVSEGGVEEAENDDDDKDGPRGRGRGVKDLSALRVVKGTRRRPGSAAIAAADMRKKVQGQAMTPVRGTSPNPTTTSVTAVQNQGRRATFSENASGSSKRDDGFSPDLVAGGDFPDVGSKEGVPDANAAQANSTDSRANVRTSCASPAGKAAHGGRGFGVKDLAALRTRKVVVRRDPSQGEDSGAAATRRNSSDATAAAAMRKGRQSPGAGRGMGQKQLALLRNRERQKARDLEKDKRPDSGVSGDGSNTQLGLNGQNGNMN